MNLESRGSLLRTLKFDPEKKLGKKLTEKPILQDPEIGIHLASTGSNYSVAEEDLVLPKLICGLEQGNRPSVIKETTSLGANGWARWPPLYSHREYVWRKFSSNVIMGF
jgi:hypothetical protein